jgi:hypothetical protein
MMEAAARMAAAARLGDATPLFCLLTDGCIHVWIGVRLWAEATMLLCCTTLRMGAARARARSSSMHAK